MLSEQGAQNAPFRTSCDSATPAKSVAKLWVMLPAMVYGTAAPPIESVPVSTGMPHSAARMIWSLWVLA